MYKLCNIYAPFTIKMNAFSGVLLHHRPSVTTINSVKLVATHTSRRHKHHEKNTPAASKTRLTSISRGSATHNKAGNTAPTRKKYPHVQEETLPFNSIPGPTGVGQWPIIGTVLLFKPFSKFTSSSVDGMLEDLFARYGSIVRCQLRGSTVLVRDVQDMEVVFRNEGLYPRRPSLQLPLQFARRNKVKEGFNEVQGEAWYKLRAPLTKRLARVDSATYYMADQNKVADDFRDLITTGNDLTPEDLSDLFFRFTAESIGVVCFNTRLGFLSRDFADQSDAVTYLSASKEIFRLLHEEVRGKSIMHRFYRNKTYRRFENTELTLKYYSGKQMVKAAEKLAERQRVGEFDPEEPNLLFSLLTDPGLDIEDIRNLMNTLYVAGTDSTAKNLQVLFYNLATNPDKQEKLYEEIMDIIGPNDPLTPARLEKMPYLKAALKESFRLYCPIMGISRYLPVDVVLNGYHVPAGTQVLICSTAVGHAHFRDPGSYLPERWLRSQQGRQREQNTHPMASLPFGYGPRNCIGRRFAEQEMYIATVKILQRLKIGIKPESAGTKFTYSIFVGPDKPIAFTFTER